MVKEATANEELGVKVGGQVISMIRYADDFEGSGCKQWEELAKVNGQCEAGHTGVWHEDQRQEDESNVQLCISRQGKSEVKIYIDGLLLEQVQQFRYLGSLITGYGKGRNGKWRT